jgi:mannosyltransferase
LKRQTTMSNLSARARAGADHLRFHTSAADDTGFSKSSAVIFALVVLLFAFARVYRLTSYGLFGDEIFSAWLVTGTWGDLIGSVVSDVVHPPLFYILMKAWASLGGYSLLWLKLFPALASIAFVIPFVLLCRELRVRPNTVNLVLGLMAINSFLVSYGQELRMYSLLVLLSTISLWLFVRFFNSESASKRRDLALFATNLLLVYTHYYGWLIVWVELLFLIVWGRKKARVFLMAVAALAICFAPWVYLVTEAAMVKGGLAPNLNWNNRPALSEFVLYYASLSGPLGYRWKHYGMTLQMILFITPVAIWGGRALRAKEKNDSEGAIFWWLFLFSFLPVVLSFVASHLLPQSIWAIRYLLISAPPYLILLAASTLKLRARWARYALLFIIIAFSFLSGVPDLYFRDKIAWEPLVTRMTQAEPDRSNLIKVYTDNWSVGNTIQFYLEQSGETRFEVNIVEKLEGLPEDYYWAAMLKYKHETKRVAQEIFNESEYAVGQIIEGAAPGHQVFLFSVRRK